jgi:acyl-CoA thioesterase I
MRPRPSKPVEADDELADSIGARGLPWHAPSVRYVALGDSYTIGTSVAEVERWPNQLVAALAPDLTGDLALDSARIELAGNLAVNGFTSRDVIEVELPRLPSLRPAFVSLLIGVNDVVQGVPPEAYRRNVEAILDDLAGRVGATQLVVVTTPDYTVTPAGADYGDPARQAAGIWENNRILTGAAVDRGVVVVDIHDISLRARDDRSLVARDGLHPSGEQYRLWVERVAPAVRELLAA